MKELVPELHDALKLTSLNHDVSKWSRQEHETFQKFLPTNSETWKGITQHHLGFDIYPTDPDTFYLCVADSLASNVTRIGERGSVEHRLNKLWRDAEGEKDVRLRETEEIIGLFKFLQNEPSWEEFLQRYENLLWSRPEDFRQGLNTTSLYTHCKLTGQFYRILKGSPAFSLLGAEIDGKTKDELESLYQNKWVRLWQLTVTKCKFHFSQKPFRVRDLNIFSALDDLIKEICTSYPDNVLLATSNELLLILSDEAQLSNIAEIANQQGFWVEIIKSQRALKELKPNPESMPGKEFTNLYNLPREISPPICEICQSARATTSWPEDYILSHLELCPNCQQLLSQNPLSVVIDLICEADRAKLEDILEEPTREELCENCYTLRAEGTKLQKLDRWGKEEQNKIAWMKLNLDFNQLETALKNLSGKDVSFSVVAEFQEDYSRFLAEFSDQTYATFGTENVEHIMTDFLCVKIGTFKRAFEILQTYHELMKNFFPAFLNLQASPLKIAIVCSNIKFPFFEVWRMLEEAQEDVFISLQGTRTMRAPARTLELITKAASLSYQKTALHKLMKIEQTSEKLAELTFQNRNDDDRTTYSSLAKTLRPSLDFSSIFTFARLMED